MIVIGLDPGTATVGYAILSGTKLKPEILTFGVIQTSSKDKMDFRLHEIGADLESLLAQYRPDRVVIEELFFFKNQKTVISVAQARGVLMYICAKSNLEMLELTPLQLKQALTGYGRASKLQVQTVIKKVFKLQELPKPDDAADALAIAWCGLK